MFALGGVTHQMSLQLEDQCILGIWAKGCVRSLIWFVEIGSTSYLRGRLNRIQRRMELCEGLTWSWMSSNRHINYRLWHPYARYVDENS